MVFGRKQVFSNFQSTCGDLYSIFPDESSTSFSNNSLEKLEVSKRSTKTFKFWRNVTETINFRALIEKHPQIDTQTFYSSLTGFFVPKLLITEAEDPPERPTLNKQELYCLIWYIHDFLNIIGSRKLAGLRSKCTDNKPTKMTTQDAFV